MVCSVEGGIASWDGSEIVRSWRGMNEVGEDAKWRDRGDAMKMQWNTRNGYRDAQNIGRRITGESVSFFSFEIIRV